MFKIGLDAEVFARRDNSIVPAAFALGKPHERRPWRMQVARAASFYADGAAVEFGVRPSADVTDLVTGVGNVIDALSLHLEQVSGTRPYLISRAAVGMDNVRELDKSWGRDASLQILGCNQDYCVYTGMGITERPDPMTTDVRTIGFHFHAGIWEEYPELKEDLFVRCAVVVYDHVIGTSEVFLDQSEEARLRKLMYGKAGMHRIPEHGVEYRPMNSSSVLSSPRLFELQARVFQAATAYVVDRYLNFGMRGIEADFGTYDVWVANATNINAIRPNIAAARYVHERSAEIIGCAEESAEIRTMVADYEVDTWLR